MSLDRLIVNEFWGKLGKYVEYFKDQGVDLQKVRFNDSPNFIYDYEQNLISANPNLFYDGNLVPTKKTITVNCENYDVTNINIAELINNTELGVVICVENLVKTYVDGNWVLNIKMAFLDEKMEILNDFDDSWDVKDIEVTFKDKITSIMDYFSENISDISFMLINPIMIAFLKQMEGYDEETNTYLELPIKINSNMREDIIALCTHDETFYLKITND